MDPTFDFFLYQPPLLFKLGHFLIQLFKNILNLFMASTLIDSCEKFFSRAILIT